MPRNKLVALLFFPLLLVAGAACDKEDEERLINPAELLTSHTWQSESYIFSGDESMAFEWDCRFWDHIDNDIYEVGDYGRMEVSLELTFRKDSLFRRVINMTQYSRCGSCDNFKLEGTASDTLRSRYLVVGNNIYFGTRDYPTQFNYYVEFLNTEKIKMQEFYDVFKLSGNSDCSFNGNELNSNRQYSLDVVFTPKKM